MSGSNCCFLTCIQVAQGAGKVIWYSHLFNNFLWFAVIHTVKAFGVVYKAEVDKADKAELSCIFDDPRDVGYLIPSSSDFSQFNLNIWKFLVHVLLKPYVKNFEPYFAGLWIVCNCACCPWFLLICFICIFIHLCTFSATVFQCICRNGHPHVFPIMFSVFTQSIFTATF